MSDKNLRAGLIRLAHSKPELRAELLPLLAKAKQAGQGKQAFEAADVVEELVGGHRLYREALMGIYKSDPETAGIMRKAFAGLADMLSLSSAGSEALGRLRQVVMNYGKASWDEALIRNNVFKAAVSLGIPTGSLKFADGMAKEADAIPSSVRLTPLSHAGTFMEPWLHLACSEAAELLGADDLPELVWHSPAAPGVGVSFYLKGTTMRYEGKHYLMFQQEPQGIVFSYMANVFGKFTEVGKFTLSWGTLLGKNIAPTHVAKLIEGKFRGHG
jgi:hypothetical protein